MLFEGNKIWLLIPELIQAAVDMNCIKTGLKRNRKGEVATWKHKSSAYDKRVKLIDYDSLPESTRSKLPLREELITQCLADITEDKLVQENDAIASIESLQRSSCDIQDYYFFIKKVLDKSKAHDLMLAAGWLRFLNKYRTPKETRLIGFNTKLELRESAVEKLIAQAKAKKGLHLYGFKVTNAKVLQRKEGDWAKAYEGMAVEDMPMIEAQKNANEAALSTLVNENFGNNHRRVLGKLNENEADRILLPSGRIDFSEWNARTLVWIFMNPGKANKYDFENLYRRYEYKCREENRKPAVSISAVKEFLTSNEVKLYTTRERSGWAELDKMLPHVYGKRSQFSLSKVGYDGFQVDFNTRMIVNGKPKQLMLTVVAMFDYMSEAVTGFDIGLVEDGKMVRTMFRNHLNTMGGRSPIEVESDRFSGNLADDTRGLFEKTCRIITQPVPNDPQGKAPNPKARFVERLIQELNRLSQNVQGWKGTNITSIDKNRKPNPDYRSENFTEGYSESVSQIITLINIYNNDTYNREQSRIAVCMENINPNAITIPQENIALLLNQSTQVKVVGGLVSFIVNRRKYDYQFPEFDQFVHLMEKGFFVTVYYDEANMDTVDVFGMRDQYIGTLGREHRVVRAKAEQTADDLHRLGVMSSNRKKAISRIEGPSRKVLELQAADFGIDISNMSMKDAQEVIAGMMDIRPEELYEEALSTPNAIQTRNYYEDRLLRANGEAVPVTITKKEAKGHDAEIKRLAREKYLLRQSDQESINP